MVDCEPEKVRGAFHATRGAPLLNILTLGVYNPNAIIILKLLFSCLVQHSWEHFVHHAASTKAQFYWVITITIMQYHTSLQYHHLLGQFFGINLNQFQHFFKYHFVFENHADVTHLTLDRIQWKNALSWLKKLNHSIFSLDIFQDCTFGTVIYIIVNGVILFKIEI